MALRPTELQIILSATRDIERAQQIQQQLPRSQQESLALQFQHEIEQRKRQTQSADKTEQGDVDKVSSEDKQGGRRRQKNSKSAASRSSEEQSTDSKGDHIIDLLI